MQKMQQNKLINISINITKNIVLYSGYISLSRESEKKNPLSLSLSFSQSVYKQHIQFPNIAVHPEKIGRSRRVPLP